MRADHRCQDPLASEWKYNVQENQYFVPAYQKDAKAPPTTSFRALNTSYPPEVLDALNISETK